MLRINRLLASGKVLELETFVVNTMIELGFIGFAGYRYNKDYEFYIYCKRNDDGMFDEMDLSNAKMMLDRFPPID